MGIGADSFVRRLSEQFYGVAPRQVKERAAKEMAQFSVEAAKPIPISSVRRHLARWLTEEICKSSIKLTHHKASRLVLQLPLLSSTSPEAIYNRFIFINIARGQ